MWVSWSSPSSWTMTTEPSMRTSTAGSSSSSFKVFCRPTLSILFTLLRSQSVVFFERAACLSHLRSSAKKHHWKNFRECCDSNPSRLGSLISVVNHEPLGQIWLKPHNLRFQKQSHHHLSHLQSPCQYCYQWAMQPPLKIIRHQLWLTLFQIQSFCSSRMTMDSVPWTMQLSATRFLQRKYVSQF